MQKGTISIVISSLAIVLSIGSVVWHHTREKKIGYVRSKELFEGYVGMKEAASSYKLQVEKWQANLDTLTKEYQKSLDSYTLNSAKLSKKEKQVQERYLETKEQSLETYREAIEQKAVDQDKQIMQGVVNQVNSFVQQYGKENGYDIIFGTMAGGNILYGREAVDVTEPVLKSLNEKYKGM